MCRAERIIFAFAALGEARKPPACAQGANAVAATRQDLVRIALVANIPDQTVIWRVEDIMDRGRQFDDAQASAQMAAGYRNCRYGFSAQFIRELAKLRRGKFAKVRGHFNRVE